MVDATCLFCGRERDGRSKKFCTTCLPPYGEWGDNGEGYGRRYSDLYRACGFQSPYPASKLPKSHPSQFESATCLYRDCDAEFLRRCQSNPKAFCSDLCKNREKYFRQIDKGNIRRTGRIRYGFRDCAWCFAPFEAATTISHFCSQACSKYMRHHISVHRSPNSCCLPVCIDCNQVFGASPFSTGHWNDGNRCRECLAGGNNRERRLVARRLGDKPSVQRLAERDGDRCHLCQEPINLDLNGYQWMGPTIDHVVPISMGGEDTMANTAMAHRKCNVVRGNRPLPDVQLKVC